MTQTQHSIFSWKISHSDCSKSISADFVHKYRLR